MKKLILILFVVGCTSPSDQSNESANSNTVFSIAGVYANNQFDGARMNNFEKTGDMAYTATISPENIPINASAYFAFQIWSDQNQTISLSLKYTHHKHRYAPKLSVDGNVFQTLDSPVALNNDSTVATFQVALSSKPLWVSAQEVTSSTKTYEWVDELVNSNSFLTKEIAGETAKQQPIFVVKSETPERALSAVIIARQHPPETPGGSIAFKAFFEALLSEGELATDFREAYNLYVFPLLNPDGADLSNWRHNANGVDLNRDWEDFSQPETQVVKSYISDKVNEESKSIRFGIDFHTSYSGPYLLILDSLNEANMQTQIIPNWIESIEVDSLEMGDYRRRDQALPYCYNWFFKTWNAEAVTYEEGDEIDRSIIRARAQLYAEKWMESMLKNL